MTTLKQEHSRDAAYWGDRPDWLIAYTQHRDSDTITRANWIAFLKALGGVSDTVAIERSNHWAVGWVEYLVVDPQDKERVGLVEEMKSRLEDYPVIDDELWSSLEWDEYQEAWRDYGRAEFVRRLAKRHQLSDAAQELLDTDAELQCWFEGLIPSGEYYIAEGSGVSVRVDCAVRRCDRDLMARRLRGLRRE